MIGIFDSGIGGLTVARAVEQLLPEVSLLYYGDTARTPYGNKSGRAILDYSLRNGEFLLEKGAKLIVIGCNSASSIAAEAMRTTFHVPVLEVISPAAKQADVLSRNKRIGVIGTRATIRSGIYEGKLRKSNSTCRVISIPCPLLVPLVEEGWVDRRETKMILRRYLHPLKEQQVDTLILGCTHYPLLKHLIQARMGAKVEVIDSSVTAAAELRALLEQLPEPPLKRTSTQHIFYLSDITETAPKIAARLFGRPVELRLP